MWEWKRSIIIKHNCTHIIHGLLVLVHFVKECRNVLDIETISSNNGMNGIILKH